MRIGFAGNPAVAAAVLGHLLDAGCEVDVVVTSPPKRRGRGADLVATPVERLARTSGLLVASGIEAFVDREVDLGVVVAFGEMIREPVLTQVQLVNLHFSLLPRWRGAAPVEWAILSGDRVTGVCLMGIEEALDAGPIFAQSTTLVGEKSLDTLWSELALSGSALLLDWIRSGRPPGVPQQGLPTYARKLSAADRRIDWGASPERILATVRLGGAWTMVGSQRLLVHEASLNEAPGAVQARTLSGEVLWLHRLQPAGRAAMTAQQWRQGYRGEAEFL